MFILSENYGKWLKLSFGKKLKTIGKDFISLNVIAVPKTWEAAGSFATNCSPMLWWKVCTIGASKGVMFVGNFHARRPFKLQIIV